MGITSGANDYREPHGLQDLPHAWSHVFGYDASDLVVA
jgi:hypothetical protein